jgi:hypothetical protein
MNMKNTTWLLYYKKPIFTYKYWFFYTTFFIDFDLERRFDLLLY